MARSFRYEDSLSPVLISEVCFTKTQGFSRHRRSSLTRSASSLGALAMGYAGTNLELGFKQCSLHHIMQAWRVYSFSTFSLSPAFPPCYCPLAFRHQVKRLAYRTSSESYPGNQVCVVSCHGATSCSRGQIVPTPSNTRVVTGQTVNYFGPFVKGAEILGRKAVTTAMVLGEQILLARLSYLWIGISG